MSYLEIIDAHKHNLKHLHLKLPKKQLIVICGVSGSGKSTLAYDTIFQEGQRKYLESLSAYARQFIKSLERPDVQLDQGHRPHHLHRPEALLLLLQLHGGHRLRGRPLPAAAVRQAGRGPLPALRRADQPLFRREDLATRSSAASPAPLARIFSPLVRNRRGNYQALFEKYRKRGFLKTLVDGREYYLDEPPHLDRNSRHHIAVQIDAVEVEPAEPRAHRPTASPWP